MRMFLTCRGQRFESDCVESVAYLLLSVSTKIAKNTFWDPISSWCINLDLPKHKAFQSDWLFSISQTFFISICSHCVCLMLLFDFCVAWGAAESIAEGEEWPAVSHGGGSGGHERTHEETQSRCFPGNSLRHSCLSDRYTEPLCHHRTQSRCTCACMYIYGFFCILKIEYE